MSTAEAIAIERPILFSSPMVRAILEGRKTQTRRVMKPQLVQHDFKSGGVHWAFVKPQTDFEAVGLETMLKDNFAYYVKPLPYGRPGDRLWVRETLRRDPDANVWYYAAGKPEDWVTVSPDRHSDSIVWAHHKTGDVCTSIHMPRWASRITLEITKVRVERLQDISREDVRAEGVSETYGEGMASRFPKLQPHEWDNLRFDEQWRMCWDSINSKRGFGWDSNPWVWVIEFKRVNP